MGMKFQTLFDYVDRIDITENILEIGSDRGEGSTTILGHIAHVAGKKLYSVDMDPAIIDRNQKKYTKLPIEFVCQKGEDFLDQNSNLKFSVVLLDNFDWDWNSNKPHDDIMQGQVSRYKNEFDLDLTNINSQKVHLLQAIKLKDMFSENAMVVCDDTWVTPDNTYTGKCGSAIPYLMLLGFELAEHNNIGAGVILIRNKKNKLLN